MDCDFCERQTRWIVHAAYDIEGEHYLHSPTGNIHPLLSRYPAPMARACDEHLTIFLIQDSKSTASSLMWVVIPAEEPKILPQRRV